MTYEAELQFLQRILDQLKLPFLLVCDDEQSLPTLDMGLRSALGMAEDAMHDWRVRMKGRLKEKVLFFICDTFSCHYILMKLPARDPEAYLVVGPYTTENVDVQWITEFMEKGRIHSDWLPVLENFYHRIRYLEQEYMLIAALQALAEHIWGVQQYTIERIEQGVPENWRPLNEAPDPLLRDDILSHIRTIEQRYEAENRLMELVSQGRGQKVQLMLSHFSRAALERRGDPTRDAKNYTIILNTLMRKAVEKGGVHPLYIDRVSTDFAKRIEQTADWKALMSLWDEMANTYCLMVRKLITKNLSPTVQKVVSRIDFDLSADLSLRATAHALNVTPSYLSALFRKETGETLTNFVNRKRMEHAAYLLSSTQLPVSTVALSCGISDDNYFTKLFKRQTGLTPVQFRREQRFRR